MARREEARGATFIPSHGNRRSATMTIMIHLSTRHNHELVQVEHDSVPEGVWLE